MAETRMPNADELRRQYPSNSVVQRRELEKETPKRDKVEKVVKGAVSVQQPSFGQKIKSMLLPADAKDIFGYAVNQLIIPGLKNGALILLEMAFFGEVRKRAGGNIPVSQRTNYSNISYGGQPIRAQPNAQLSNRERATHNFQNIIFETYDDAKDVVETLLDLIDRYGSATVGDYYSACGYSADYTDDNWGWKSFQKLEPRRIREGYVIDMQSPVLLTK